MRAKTFVASLSTTLIVAGLASLWAVASPTSASCAAAFAATEVTAAPAESSAFVDQINQVRASKGLGALVVDSNLSSVAQQWAEHMGEAQAISHRGNLAAGVTIDWKMLGENVGLAPTVNDMMSAFVNSPVHYENIVNGSFTRIGIGTVRTPDGELYSAHEFASVRSAAPAPAPAPAKVVAQHAAPVVAAVAAPAPSTSTTVAAPAVIETVTVEHVPAATHVAGKSTNAPAAKAHTGC
ncbi:MAG: hypothetical protein QOK28_2659 [Actinomycetota bacterium]|jgi:uncharacterized protein YkwD